MAHYRSAAAVVAFVLAACLGLGSAAAKTSSHLFKKAGVNVSVPAKWSVKTGAVFRATPPKKVAFVAVEITTAKSLAAAKASLAQLVRKYVGQPKLGPIDAVKVGRFEAVRASGTGRMDGMPLIFDVFLYDTGGRILMGIGFAPSAVQPRFSASILNILKSLH